MNDKYEVNQHKSNSKISSLIWIFKKLLLQRNVPWAMSPISQDTQTLKVCIQAEKETVFKQIGGDFYFYNTTQLEKPWDHWVKSWLSVSNLSHGWFSKNQQQPETLMTQLLSCIYWVALVFKQIYRTINAWLKDRIVSLAPMWLDDLLKKSALWGQPSWRREETLQGLQLAPPALHCLGHRDVLSIKALVPLLSIDPAGNNRASNHTAFLYLHRHTPKSYFQKQCEYLWE